MEKRKELWRALPCVMALLLLTLVPMQSASALFGKGKEEAKAVDGAPVAENMEIKVYRGVAYEGEFRAVDNEGDEVTFAIAQEPKKGMVALTEDGLGFVYTPGGKLGTDSFTYTAIDAYGNTSLPATVSITIEKAYSGVCYADMGGGRAEPAASRDGRGPLGLRRAGRGQRLVRTGGGEFAVRQRDREWAFFH